MDWFGGMLVLISNDGRLLRFFDVTLGQAQEIVDKHAEIYGSALYHPYVTRIEP